MNRTATIGSTPSDPATRTVLTKTPQSTAPAVSRRVFPAPTSLPDMTLRETATISDRLSPFRRHVAFLRWITLLLQGVLLLADQSYQSRRVAVAFAVLGLWTVYRTIQPLRHGGNERADAALLLAEMILAVGVVVVTGGWTSPLTLALLPPIVVGGFLQGSLTAVGFGLCTGVIVTLVDIQRGPVDAAGLQRAIQWTGLLMLVSLVTGFGHRLISDASLKQQATVVQMSELTRANTLLAELHRVVQRLPSSLDLADVLRTTTADLRTLTGMSVSAVLLRDAVMQSWSVAEADGSSLPLTLSTMQLPAAAQRAASTGLVVSAAELVNATVADTACSTTEFDGLSGTVISAFYAPLRTRGELIGLIAVEDSDVLRDDDTIRQMVEQFAEPAAMAIDNARWFGRIRSVAADEERVRIARDLHDRIGQSLALIGFEVDRIARSATDTGTKHELVGLRANVRAVVSEVRETLYDIRADVQDGNGIADTLDEFLSRVSTRSGLGVHLDAEGAKPLPVRQEREMWHIAQEAVVNVERHASAQNVWVRWRCDGVGALLEVRDDGVGFSGASGRVDSYGMRGLRERAAGIGARLEIESRSGQGTTVRCRLIE